MDRFTSVPYSLIVTTLMVSAFIYAASVEYELRLCSSNVLGLKSAEENLTMSLQQSTNIKYFTLPKVSTRYSRHTYLSNVTEKTPMLVTLIREKDGGKKTVFLMRISLITQLNRPDTLSIWFT